MIKNEVGNKYGDFTVISRADNDKHDNAKWLCKCDCGAEKVFSGAVLRKKRNTHKCKKHNTLVGRVINDLTVLAETERRITSSGVSKRRYTCKCVCGNLIDVDGDKLSTSRQRSCGCYLIRNPSQATHRLSGTKSYTMWTNMMNRCYDPNHHSESYKKKGVEVCEAWKDVENFHAWVVENGWEEGLNLDRIDNEGNYEPGNCRFVTTIVNAHNKGLNKTNKTGFEGVWYDKQRNKFQSYISGLEISAEGRVSLGRFNTAVQAAQARDMFILIHNLPNHKLQVISREEYEKNADGLLAYIKGLFTRSKERSWCEVGSL